MSKGKDLNKLFDLADELHSQMNNIFLRNGLNTPDLHSISEADREEWYRLKTVSDELSTEITNLINKKPETLQVGDIVTVSTTANGLGNVPK